MLNAPDSRRGVGGPRGELAREGADMGPGAGAGEVRCLRGEVAECGEGGGREVGGDDYVAVLGEGEFEVVGGHVFSFSF